MDTLAMEAPMFSAAQDAVTDRIRGVAAELSTIVEAIDKGQIYPAALMRRLGEAGAWGSHLPRDGGADLAAAIEGMAVVAEHCGATAFLGWCQNALVWYLANSGNEDLRNAHLEALASGKRLGGSGLSNPVKSLSGIEGIKLKGRKIDGGYIVRGNLLWVSNLGEDHLFAAICEDTTGAPVMFVADCAAPDIRLTDCAPFLAMDGTATYSVQFRDAFIPDAMVLAHSAVPFVAKIRAGFILLQMGMAIGLIRDCINIMHEMRGTLGHVNKFLEDQPEDFEELLAAMEKETRILAATPYDTSEAYWRRVLALRLRGGEASIAAAHAAMLHCGARGYVMAHRAQRRLREAYFVAIVTPATKQLRKMLAELPN
ncbi:acyl-CoA dehydrogenase family protein [Methylovirgula sp. HY1]|uniref:acyl-CoA dehydrogenase family protein n=1 Tax=Methylovirgula sp. HY1 TaxID=2822761 RepID=UPI001C75B5D4|nr:Acyl-CoA dehydrogenase, short-chain specific [Methylovirgula sp. HY1]